ncbi:uncharacterized protein LOC120490938 isoform X1 [Pimephales promelas]|uniref:uncharacterized protein LOC120490938 isoform X1 n=1 Tax=Pimephales promelas TaxID=90988 RepID=UPI00195582F0|nr:uncharacterized protein LOC120490938 isoform X1 [Pimephales promelas]
MCCHNARSRLGHDVQACVAYCLLCVQFLSLLYLSNRPNKPNKRVSKEGKDRFERRITRLRKHHNECSRRHSARQKAKESSKQTPVVGPIMPHQTPDDQVPSPLKKDILALQLMCRERSLEDSKAKMDGFMPSDVTKQSLSTKKSVDTDSDVDTLITDLPSSSESPRACDIPELKRTDSVFVTKKSLNTSCTSDDPTSCTSDDPVSSIDNSEDDYVPDSESSSEESEESLPQPFAPSSPSITLDGKVDTSSSMNEDKESPPHEDEETMTQSDNSSSEEVSVMKLKKTAKGQRMFNKKQYCFYCSKPFSKMARHLAQVHKNEVEVAKALSFPKSSKERRINLDFLRNKGNHVHNTNVLKAGKGVLVPRQQSTAKHVNVKDYMHCLNCQGLFRRKALWRHMQRCNLAKKCQVTKQGRSRVQALCAYAQPVPEGVTKKLWKLISDMKQDEVTQAVKSDTCILKFGEHLCNKMGSDKTKHEYIRTKMREVGRLLVCARKVGNLQSIKDFFIPSNFYHVIKAVKDTSGFRDEDEVFTIPSLALKLGHSLKKMSRIAECEAMIAGDSNDVKNVKMFMQMYETKWNEHVSSSALKTLNEAKWNSPELLPFTEDVKKLHIHLSNETRLYQEKLKLEKIQKNWSQLAQITLCEVILFNRRRAGEVSKMRLNSYVLRNTSVLHSDVADALSEVEQKLCQHFQRIEIRGKRDRKVPILLTPSMLASMELLVQNRQTCGVLDENYFFFAKPMTETSFYRGTDCIRKVAHQCGAKHPKNLSSTKLRKHIATLSKVLNLRDTEMDQLADFLGHDIRVHRKFYRLPEGTLQLAKISKVLMALEQGRVSEFKGKNLDEINLEPNEKVNVGSDESESEDEESEMPQPEKRRQSSSASTEESLVGSQSSRESEMPPPKKRRQSPSTSTEDLSFGCKSAKEKELPSKSGVSKGQKRKWTEDEVKAVENKLLHFITSGRVPGKRECEDCIRSAPVLLQNRTWEAVKFYIKNRITALKRECEKRK